MIFVAILLYGLLGGHGGFLTAKPSPHAGPDAQRRAVRIELGRPVLVGRRQRIAGRVGLRRAVRLGGRTQRGTDRRAVELRGTGVAERIRASPS